MNLISLKIIKKEIYDEIAKLSHRSVSEILPSLKLSIDLGMDSLDLARLYAFLDERFDMVGVLMSDLHTVSDVLRATTQNKVQSPRRESGMPSRIKWPVEKRPPVVIPEGKTIQEVFLKTCDRMGKLSCCVDQP